MSSRAQPKTCRNWVGDRFYLGGFGVDAQRHPHHDRAQIEGPGRGGVTTARESGARS